MLLDQQRGANSFFPIISSVATEYCVTAKALTGGHIRRWTKIGCEVGEQHKADSYTINNSSRSFPEIITKKAIRASSGH